MELELKGKTAIVTGGSSGIGLATVRCLIDEGMNVVTCARNEQRLQSAIGQVDVPSGQLLHAQRCDVLKRDEVEALVAAAIEHTGRLDVLINNAGRGRRSTFQTTDDDAWREELELKFFSVINPTRSALPHLTSVKGSVVNVNAVLARQPEPHMVATSAARAGVLNLSRSMAAEFAPHVRVNSVLIGVVRSEQWRRSFRESGSELDEDAWYAEQARVRDIPLGRFGFDSEVAQAIAFLASPKASYITGATLDVSGGFGRYL